MKITACENYHFYSTCYGSGTVNLHAPSYSFLFALAAENADLPHIFANVGKNIFVIGKFGIDPITVQHQNIIPVPAYVTLYRPL